MCSAEPLVPPLPSVSWINTQPEDPKVGMLPSMGSCFRLQARLPASHQAGLCELPSGLSSMVNREAKTSIHHQPPVNALFMATSVSDNLNTRSGRTASPFPQWSIKIIIFFVMEASYISTSSSHCEHFITPSLHYVGMSALKSLPRTIWMLDMNSLFRGLGYRPKQLLFFFFSFLRV